MKGFSLSLYKRSQKWEKPVQKARNDMKGSGNLVNKRREIYHALPPHLHQLLPCLHRQNQRNKEESIINHKICVAKTS